MSFEGRFDRVDRGNILPRPKREIPIWIGGFKEAAFRRAGNLGDGFMFAGDADTGREQWERVQAHLADAGRSDEGYGRDLITITSRSVDECVKNVEAWREMGGTHASVCTMGMGLDSTAAHVDFMGEVAAKLGR